MCIPPNVLPNPILFHVLFFESFAVLSKSVTAIIISVINFVPKLSLRCYIKVAKLSPVSLQSFELSSARVIGIFWVETISNEELRLAYSLDAGVLIRKQKWQWIGR